MIVSFVCPSSPAPMGGVTALYEFANGLSRRGHEVHIADGAFWGRPGVTSLDELDWFRFEPDVHHHFGAGAIPLPDADVIFGTEAPARMGLPVLIIQGFEMFPKEMERETFRTPCLKVCVASWLIGVGVEYGVPPDQLVHVVMGIDHDTFRVTKPIESRAARVGMLYNSHPAKGWSPGWEALELVHHRVPEMSAVIFGTEIPEEALPDWATFVFDPTPEALVDDVYNQCSIFVQPSYYEGFGFTAVEAMACGCALVTTDNGGSDDYARPDETALLSPPADVDQLAANIEQLLRDDDKRFRLARRGATYVERFDWDRGAEALEGHLERYVADPAAYQRVPVDDGVATEGAS